MTGPLSIAELETALRKAMLTLREELPNGLSVTDLQYYWTININDMLSRDAPPLSLGDVNDDLQMLRREGKDALVSWNYIEVVATIMKIMVATLAHRQTNQRPE